MKTKDQNLSSCIYEGTIRHRRFTVANHEFLYRVFMMYVDLDEMTTAFDRFWFWSAAKRNIAWFRRSDYLGSASNSLVDSVKAEVQTRFGVMPSGPIRLLTNFRYFGFSINPISIYYCFNRDEQVDFVVTEVTNTPWGEKQIYVLDAREQSGNSRLQLQVEKAMHVSPFLEMDYQYQFQMNSPDKNLSVHIENHPVSNSTESDLRPAFDATLLMKRKRLTSFNLASVLCRFPLMTFRVFAKIHWQALRLWLKGVKVQPHPGEKRETVSIDASRYVNQPSMRTVHSQVKTPNYSSKKIHECT
jgi:DUF1365 family protein